jgi:hypothetical protein
MEKYLKNYVKFLEGRGLSVVHGGKHLKVYQGQKLVSTISCTAGPNSPRVNVRDLVRAGVLDESAKRLKF